jgi:hypothetical protein
MAVGVKPVGGCPTISAVPTPPARAPRAGEAVATGSGAGSSRCWDSRRPLACTKSSPGTEPSQHWMPTLPAPGRRGVMEPCPPCTTRPAELRQSVCDPARRYGLNREASGSFDEGIMRGRPGTARDACCQGPSTALRTKRAQENAMISPSRRRERQLPRRPADGQRRPSDTLPPERQAATDARERGRRRGLSLASDRVEEIDANGSVLPAPVTPRRVRR